MSIWLDLNPLNKKIQQEEMELSMKFKISIYLIEKMFLQSRKAMWVKLGDDNTKYFHSVLMQK